MKILNRYFFFLPACSVLLRNFCSLTILKVQWYNRCSTTIYSVIRNTIQLSKTLFMEQLTLKRLLTSYPPSAASINFSHYSALAAIKKSHIRETLNLSTCPDSLGAKSVKSTVLYPSGYQITLATTVLWLEQHLNFRLILNLLDKFYNAFFKQIFSNFLK